MYASCVVHARGPANVRRVPFTFSFRKAIKVKRAMSYKNVNIDQRRGLSKRTEKGRRDALVNLSVHVSNSCWGIRTPNGLLFQDRNSVLPNKALQ